MTSQRSRRLCLAAFSAALVLLLAGAFQGDHAFTQRSGMSAPAAPQTVASAIPPDRLPQSHFDLLVAALPAAFAAPVFPVFDADIPAHLRPRTSRQYFPLYRRPPPSLS